jgi:biotin transport system substrate-specific component
MKSEINQAVPARRSSKDNLRWMLMAALTAALIALCAQVAIPLPLVPVNLALLSVFLAGFILPKRWAVISVGLYLLMGALGLPVFSGFRGGPQVLFGPTGGYLLGYLFSAGALALLRDKVSRFSGRFLICLLALLLCYIPGTLWLLRLTGRPLVEVLSFAVLPFIPGDALKSLAASLLVPALQRALESSLIHS